MNGRGTEASSNRQRRSPAQAAAGETLHTFTARTTAEALRQVKQALGADAVILGTRIVPASGPRGLVGQQRVEITAARPARAAGAEASTPAAESARSATSQPESAAAATVGRERRIERDERIAADVKAKPAAGAASEIRADLLPMYQRLVEQEVAERWIRQILDDAQRTGGRAAGPEEARLAVRTAIAKLIPAASEPESRRARRRVALVGPAGAGKTTTLAKLAAHYRLKEKRAVAVLSLDLQGLTSNDLLRRYAELIGVPFHAAQSVTAVKEQLAALGSAEVVLIDTFGVSPRDDGKFLRLASLVRAARPDEVHLALPATMNASAQARYRESYGPLAPTKMILTRLDEAAGMGVILNAVAQLGLALSFTTDGPHVPRDIQWGCGTRLAELLCPS